MPKFLVTIDFSEETQTALEFTARMCNWAHQGSEPEILLLTVLETLAQQNVHFQFALAMLEGHGIREELHREAENKLKSLAQEYFPQTKCRIKVIQAKKAAHLEIAECALSEKADLLIAARQDRSGMSQVIMGSILEKLIREAPCPTIIVPPKGKEKILREPEAE